MARIIINKGIGNAGSFAWSATEDFSELFDREYKLVEMEAKDIEQMSDLSIRSKILLSAVAGATWQYLLDHFQNARPEAWPTISFTIREED